MDIGTQALFEAAMAVQKNAYAPYSNFQVGAALRSQNGKLFIGCNVENAAYPLCQCAEASAISAMIGGQETRIDEIVIVGNGNVLITPCGACRQRLREFAGPMLAVHLADQDGIQRSCSLAELLPLSFGPTHL